MKSTESQANSTKDVSNVHVIDDKGDIRLLPYQTLKKYISVICDKLNIKHLDVEKITNNVYPKLKSKNTVQDIDDQIIVCSSEMVIDHYDYPKIATYILINNLHKNTCDKYLDVAKQLIFNVKEGKKIPIISNEFFEFVSAHHEEIDAALNYKRDYEISIFGYRTLEKAYLIKSGNGKIIERPQHMYMRVAIALHFRSTGMDKIVETYDLLSKGYFSHATPTLFNAGTRIEQLSSCFLLGIEDDMGKIGRCWKDCAVISKNAGGIGINVTNIRINGAYINSTRGRASGMYVLTVFDRIARYANQGGKRSGSIAIYLEPWHADIFFFLELKKNTGADTERARDLFLALMVNDIFMKRVEEDGVWSLMCPNQCPNLLNKYGEEFTRIYQEYESMGKLVKQVPARDLYFKIMDSQFESGVPYMVFKDATNYKSNQINIGVVNGSNLCAEIVEVSSSDEYAVCNLVSICLPKYVKFVNNQPVFDYQELYQVSKVVVNNLNNIIDINYYPVHRTQVSNLKHRPIGIGVQGLADVFALFKTPFDSELARDLNKKIFETIYFGSLTKSMELAKEIGPYQTFWTNGGCPLSKGKFQFDLWNFDRKQLSGMWDWDSLEKHIMTYGVRNSLITACMPTASTSQINGNNETIEPYTENIYTRNTLAGDFYIVNKYLMKDLMELNLWDSNMADRIKYHQGSIQKIPNIPDDIKKIYRTVWEIDQMSIIEMAADRGPFIDQTQSMNINIAEPNFPRLNTCLMYAWKKGLKTGIYYLRSKAASEANKFGIDIESIKKIENEEKNVKICPYLPKNQRIQGSCSVCDA